MAISYLAKFHATSYCYRKEENISFDEKYSNVEEVHLPKFSSEVCAKVKAILDSNTLLSKHSNTFIDAMSNGLNTKSEFLDHFKVFCHGNFIRENLQYCYRSELESRYFCSDVVFQNLSWAHTGSCVLDLLQFLFTSIDPDVRQNFLADFVCSVYYDNFVKTVITINQNLSIFRLKHFIREFEHNLIYGFLFSLEIKLKLSKNFRRESDENCISVVQDNDEDKKEEKDFREFIQALATDIVQFKLNSRASIIN